VLCQLQLFALAQANVHSLQKRRTAVYPPKRVSAGQQIHLMPESRAGSKDGHRDSANFSVPIASGKLSLKDCRNKKA